MFITAAGAFFRLDIVKNNEVSILGSAWPSLARLACPAQAGLAGFEIQGFHSLGPRSMMCTKLLEDHVPHRLVIIQMEERLPVIHVRLRAIQEIRARKELRHRVWTTVFHEHLTTSSNVGRVGHWSQEIKSTRHTQTCTEDMLMFARETF